MRPRSVKTEDSQLKELQAIKKLLILLLVKQGYDSEDIAKAPGVTGQRIRQMVPMRITKNNKRRT